MIKKLHVVLFLFLQSTAYSQIPAYYSSVDFTQTGNNLKTQLATLITNTHTTMLPYTSSSLDTWDAIQLADYDVSNNAKVLLVYGYNDVDAPTNNDRSRSKTLMGSAGCTGFWNREHTFPQSLANPPMDTSIPGVSTDIHHLRAADCQFNSTRSNRPFTDGQGDAVTVGANNWYPGDEWKGDVARMMMYLYVRYGNVTPALTVGVGSASFSPSNDMPNVFLEWNIEDPVSIAEINRNNAIFNIQGNRNPFIDNPYLATLIWNGPQAPDFWNALTCTNTTVWNGSTWSNGVPNKNVLAVFNANFTLTSDLEMCSLTIANNVIVTIPPTRNLTVVRSITVNGTGNLIVQNNANLIQINNVTNSGNITVLKDSSPFVRLDYTSWSSPVSGQNLKAFSPNTLNNRFYEYIPSGTTPSTAYSNIDPLVNNFSPTKGYIIRAPNNWSLTATPYNGQFVGIPNNGVYQSSILQGFNMVGNPFPSTISANEFIANNRTIENLYFWSHHVPASGGTYPANNFASYTTLGGVAAAAGGQVPDGTIKPGQGFYVFSNMNEQVLFHNGQRIKTSNSQFFRESNNVEIIEKHRIWLNLSSETKEYNQILVGFSNFGTDEFDIAYDGKTMLTDITHLYSTINNEDDYVIQAKKFPLDENESVNLGIKIKDIGTYKISIDNKDGYFSNYKNILLKDNYNGNITNLTQNSYAFVSEIGDFKNRFQLVFNAQTSNTIDNEGVQIYSQNNNIILNSNYSKIDNITISDITGRTILEKTNINSLNIEINSLIKNNQTLLVKVNLINGISLLKKIIY